MKTFEYDYTAPWNGETYRRKAGAAEVKALLGLDPKKHFPDEGLEVRDVQGVPTYVTPKGAASRRRPHRVYAVCECGRHVPAGRMFQHVCAS